MEVWPYSAIMVQSNEACDHLGIKRLFANLFYPQGNTKVKMSIIFIIGPSQSAEIRAIMSGGNFFYLFVVIIIYFQVATTQNFQFFLCLDKIQQKDVCLILTIATGEKGFMINVLLV